MQICWQRCHVNPTKDPSVKSRQKLSQHEGSISSGRIPHVHNLCSRKDPCCQTLFVSHDYRTHRTSCLYLDHTTHTNRQQYVFFSCQDARTQRTPPLIPTDNSQYPSVAKTLGHRGPHHSCQQTTLSILQLPRHQDTEDPTTHTNIQQFLSFSCQDTRTQSTKPKNQQTKISILKQTRHQDT